MKKIIFSCIAILFFITLPRLIYAQQSKPVAKAFPAFTIRLSDSSLFKSSSIKKGEPVIVIYFSPTCSHCQVFISEIIKNMETFKNDKIVLVTYLDVAEVRKFQTDYNLKKYKNIIVGTEGTNFTLRYFYDVGPFPFTATYDNAHNLSSVYRKPPTMDELKKL